MTVRFEYEYGGGLGRGGKAAILVNRQKITGGRIDRTQPYIFSADEGADVGREVGTNVTDDYKEGDNRFTGKIRKLTIEVKK